jgi:hypothetical protein
MQRNTHTIKLGSAVTALGPHGVLHRFGVLHHRTINTQAATNCATFLNWQVPVDQIHLETGLELLVVLGAQGEKVGKSPPYTGSGDGCFSGVRMGRCGWVFNQYLGRGLEFTNLARCRGTNVA